MIIRPAREEDIASISQLILQVADQNPNRYTHDQLIAWQQYNSPHQIKHQISKRSVFCAFENSNLIGTIALREHFVLGFNVDHTLQNKGIGTLLLQYIEEYARSNQINYLKLTSSPSALQFYQNRGYQIIKKITLNIFDIEFSETEMEKFLI